MRIAIFENIMTPGGHEVDFDRILTEELQARGHEVTFCVPQDFVFSFDYHVPVRRLRGRAVSYTKTGSLVKPLYAAKREWNRQCWYRQLYQFVEEGAFEAVIVPTSTYRYLRALSWNKLKHISVPLLFILHGINPGEAPHFLRAAEKLRHYPNIRLIVLTFGDTIFGTKLPNVYPMYPPAYTPRDLDALPVLPEHEELCIGFFGQYRREKKLEDFLAVFQRGHYIRPVRLLVQGSTMHPEDAVDFERIINKYKACKNISFLHKGLIGREWQEAIAKVDALLMPYSAPRYRYHWGGMLFTAIGYEKPVIVSDDMNPEVLGRFHIGEAFVSGDMVSLQDKLECFINGFAEKRTEYRQELAKAAAAFAPQAFAARVEGLMTEKIDGETK